MVSTCAVLACARVARSGQVIDQFSQASCVRPSQRDSDGFPMWREAIRTQSGIQVQVRGIEQSGGLVHVMFATGESIVVDPFDYLAPTENRGRRRQRSAVCEGPRRLSAGRRADVALQVRSSQA